MLFENPTMEALPCAKVSSLGAAAGIRSEATSGSWSINGHDDCSWISDWKLAVPAPAWVSKCKGGCCSERGSAPADLVEVLLMQTSFCCWYGDYIRIEHQHGQRSRKYV